uniref:LAGLIDADG endonuclease n=3 Tax=Ceratocystis TaxID=5157 RepID=A0A5C1V9U0_9PEZI|nr:LAGLIDADG endonuclease [Ceratocystis cacaofunesta]YP_009704218.1 LAGLIDADG endonuclease [Ceratocystis fimbriata]YP_009710370.1 LAGLIDADG endonuclease [Ceratocystis albifundus]AFO38129.1 LAGLIDADG endonuclease [Ceratocystis cacaofunesta]QEN73781.1 LAGLIDADG endonuclease [Ceratocystis fimbriata]QFX74872.1 LAGLIDADG endonuclease [Ceratocystis albifundus]
MWVIAVLSHPLKGVKEQRVDGSSMSRNLDVVRCTLVAGKPVLGRKIYPDSNKSIITNNILKRSMSTLRSKLNLNPWFITGLVEAEGCFMIGFFKNAKYKMGYQIQAIFKITLHKKDYELLSQVKDYFGVGTITNHGNTTLQYTVKSLKDLDTIISHFDKFSLLSQKWADYTLFKNVIMLIKNKEHLNIEGFKKVLSIRAAMNLGLSEELKFIFPDIQPFSRPSLPKINNINPNWIAGLASGDGCFHVSIRNSSTTKTGKSVVLKFHIVQHSRDIELMKVLISTLNCGKLELLLNQSAVYFVVTNFQDIFDKIIPLFDKYKIKGVKSLDFYDFKLIANLIHNKEHLTEEGLSKIQSLKLNMNLFRKL